jgi:carbonic anhydrase
LKQLDKIFQNNKKWIRERLSSDPKYFQKLSGGQSPHFLYIGCSDSRVTAEEVMGLKPGEVFVHRNVGNLVIATDDNVNSVVQYAVEYLKVKHIIVCGHYECGAINAALHPHDMGQINSWLQTLRDVVRLHHSELNAIRNKQKRFDRLVELNVIEQFINILKIDHVQKSWFRTRTPHVHGWVFDIRTGKLKDLKLKMDDVLRDIRSIYKLKPMKKKS